MKKEPSIFTLLLLVSFSSISAVLFTPALPEIAQFFSVSHDRAQETITWFLIGYAFGQLPYGPLANRYGRKPPLIAALLLAIIGSLLCVVSGYVHQFWILLASRLIMALGTAAGLKMVFTIIGDSYSQSKAAKIIAYLIISFGIAPGIGIAIGGILTEKFQWMSCFYFLALYGILLLFLASRLPETSKKLDLHALEFAHIISGYWKQLKDFQVTLSAIIVGGGTAIIYIFAAEAPFLSIDQLKLTPTQYGLLNLIPPLGMIIGGIIATQLACYFKPVRTIGLSLGVMFFGSLAMLIAFNYQINVLSIFLPMPFIYIGEALMYPNATSLAISRTEDVSHASAIMNFINIFMGVIGMLVIERVYKLTNLMMPLTFVGVVIVMILVYFQLRKKLNNQVS